MPKPNSNSNSKGSSNHNGHHNRKTTKAKTTLPKKKDRPQIVRGQSGNTVTAAGWSAIPFNKHTNAPTHNQNKEVGKKRHRPDDKWLLIFPFGVTQMNNKIRPKQPWKFKTFWREFVQRCADNDVVLSLPQNESQS